MREVRFYSSFQSHLPFDDWSLHSKVMNEIVQVKKWHKMEILLPYGGGLHICDWYLFFQTPKWLIWLIRCLAPHSYDLLNCLWCLGHNSITNQKSWTLYLPYPPPTIPRCHMSRNYFSPEPFSFISVTFIMKINSLKRS